MTSISLSSYLAFAETLTEKSGVMLRESVRASFQHEQKPDRSWVTSVDCAVEKKLREEIERAFPTHGIWGEELGSSNLDAEYVWYLDPIDGTSSFMAGRPTFTTLIGLAHRGTPIMGVIDQPMMRDRWAGIYTPEERKATFNRSVIATRRCESMSRAMIATTGPNYFSPVAWEKFQEVSARAAGTLYGGDAYNYGLLAAGWLDVVMEENLKPHDICALAPIIQAAGGSFTTWEKKPIDLTQENSVIAQGDPTLQWEK